VSEERAGRCETCRYYEVGERETAGECHRRAPFPHPATPKVADVWTRFPLVGADDWCGEWGRRSSGGEDWVRFRDACHVRLKKFLWRKGVDSFRAVLALTKDQIWGERGVGPTTVRELVCRLRAFGYESPAEWGVGATEADYRYWGEH
jgi:hypothetical protein